MERAYWRTMVRAQTLPFDSFARATPGQVTWVFLNQSVDYDEEKARVHENCLPKWDREYCPICHEPSHISEDDLSPEVREKVYRPSEDMSQLVEVDFADNGTSHHRQELEQYLKTRDDEYTE